MVTQKYNIIAIRENNIHDADIAFADFMHKAETCFNEKSKANPKLYKGISSDELERQTVRLLRDVAPNTPFNPNNIELVAGHSFPDIVADKYYGVEVKSTKENKWTSTGSSIVESTRDKYVDNIYMMFGKLGSTPPEFKIRPYADCLSNIAVTHSPRYLIDMELKEKRDKSIFDKLKVSYNDFCKNDNKIEIVREYYIKEALAGGKQEMPWWVGRKTIESEEYNEVPPIMLMNNKNPEEIKRLKAEMVILFPQVLKSDYSEAALWLCTHRYTLSLNLRDLFSAGGQWNTLNGKRLETPLPGIIGKLLEIMPYVKAILTRESDLEIHEFNPYLIGKESKFDLWLNQVDKIFSDYKYKVGNRYISFSSLSFPLRNYLKNSEKYVLSKMNY